MDNKVTQMPQDYGKHVEWTKNAYETAGIEFADGFQKDAIQNCVGARKTNKWDGFCCDIYLESTANGTFVIVEDFGTVGLTGRNLTPSETLEIKDKYGLNSLEGDRLAKFSALNISTGSKTGAGLYGVGKTVLSMASKSYTYYYDSLRDDGKYIANCNKAGKRLEKAYEGTEAEQMIIDCTGLSPKNTTGTRIIIEDPNEELIKSIRTGILGTYIQESWWKIIERMESVGAEIKVNHVPVKPPDWIANCKYKYELPKSEACNDPKRKVKKFGLFVYENPKLTKWNGISYYRKGMKIGPLEISKDLLKEIDGRFWGYVEVDETWENELAEIEDAVHSGVKKGKKGTTVYQDLKHYVEGKLRENLVKWGIIKDNFSDNEKINETLKELASEVQDFIGSLGYENLGNGPDKPDFDVRWKNIAYPVKGSLEVTTGDEISFSVKITNKYSSKKKFKVTLIVKEKNSGRVVSEIYKNYVEIDSSSAWEEEFVHKVNCKNSAQFEENLIELYVSVVGSGKQKNKDLSFFYDIKQPINLKEYIDLTLHDIQLPLQGSRRVNYGESLKNISYRIENKRNEDLSCKLKVSLFLPELKVTIKDIYSSDFQLKPFEEIIVKDIKEQVIEEGVFKTYLKNDKGRVELRAKLIASKDDTKLEKGDKISHYYFNLFINMNEKQGSENAFETRQEDQPDKPRAWYIAGKNRAIVINVGHPAFKNLSQYEDIQRSYLKEQILKQYVMLYIEEARYDMFGSLGTEFLNLEPQDAAKAVFDKIEEIYSKSLNKR